MRYPENERRRVRVHGIEGFKDGEGVAVGEDTSYRDDPNVPNPIYVEMDDGRDIVAGPEFVTFLEEPA